MHNAADVPVVAVHIAAAAAIPPSADRIVVPLVGHIFILGQAGTVVAARAAVSSVRENTLNQIKNKAVT